MTHISEIIEDILVEWSYRVHDGMPNPKNALHIIELRESMEELNIPNNVIYRVIENLLNEEQQFYARAKDSGRIVIFKDKDKWKDSIKSGSHEKVSDADAKRELDKKDKKSLKNLKMIKKNLIKKNHQNLKNLLLNQKL